MLAEGIARERYEMEVREKAQEKVIYQPDLHVLFEILMCSEYDFTAPTLCVAAVRF